MLLRFYDSSGGDGLSAIASCEFRKLTMTRILAFSSPKKPPCPSPSIASRVRADGRATE